MLKDIVLMRMLVNDRLEEYYDDDHNNHNKKPEPVGCCYTIIIGIAVAILLSFCSC